MRQANIVTPIWEREADEKNRLFEQIWYQMELVREVERSLRETKDWKCEMWATKLQAIARYTEDLAYTIERRHTKKHPTDLMSTKPKAKRARKIRMPEAEAHAAAIDAAELIMDRER